jgi:hypothetical protein
MKKELCVRLVIYKDFTTHFTVAEHIIVTIYMLYEFTFIDPLNAELNPICHLLALLGTHHILHVSRIRVNSTRPRGLRSGSATTRLLRMRVRILQGRTWLFFFNVACCQVDGSASG